MRLDVIAFPRRHGVFLAVVIEVRPRPEGADLLSVVAEDGPRFTLPADRVLARVAADGDAGEPVAALAALRASVLATAGPDWEALHARAQPGRAYRLAELAELAGLTGEEAELRAALASDGAGPWFRREATHLIALPPGEVRAEVERRRREQWIASEGHAFLDWWPERESRGVPPEWRIASLAELGAEPPAGAQPGRGALHAVVAYAVRGERTAPGGTASGDTATGTEWGEELARRAGLPPEPDQVLEALVAVGVLRDDVNPSAYRAALAAPFGPEASAEADELAAAPVTLAATAAPDRVYLDGLVAVAVDESGTREVDDAVSLRRTEAGWELGVHVADVAAGLPCGGPLDAEIAGRASSLYVADGSVLLMPERLVTERLSLSAAEARPALSGFFTLAEDGQLLASRFERTLLRLARQVTYEATRDPASLAADAATGEVLVRLATALRARRCARGARVLSLGGLRVDLRDGRPELSLRRQDTPGDLVVSECMVCHNEQAAGVLVAAGVPALFRTQEPSDEPLPAESDPLFALKVRRTFSATHMSARPRPHAGLGATAYMQCTSPLRRYSDLVNQRQLAAVAHDETPPYDEELLAELAPLLAARERTVRRAGESRRSYWIARALADRDPPFLDGVLARAPRRGTGQVWVAEILRQMPLRAPRDWRAPAVGTTGRWRIGRVRPWRGRVDLEPAPPEAADEDPVREGG